MAYSGLADSYLSLGSYYVEMIPEAKAAAVRAIMIDPNLAEAHVALGHIKLWLDWDWTGAEREFTRGIELDANSALAHDQYAGYLATLGRAEQGVAEARRALALDPLSPIVNADLGWYEIYAGHPAEAIAQFQRTLELDADSMSATTALASPSA